MIGRKRSSLRFFRGWLKRYPGGSACARIFFRVCQPKPYFSQAARLLSSFVRTCRRTSFQNSMSDRTPGPPCEVGQDRG